MSQTAEPADLDDVPMPELSATIAYDGTVTVRATLDDEEITAVETHYTSAEDAVLLAAREWFAAWRDIVTEGQDG